MTRADREGAEGREELCRMIDEVGALHREIVERIGREFLDSLFGIEPDAEVWMPGLSGDAVVYVKVRYWLPYRVEEDE